MNKLRKLMRFISIYGIGMTLFKVFGRLRLTRLGLHPRRGANIGVLGSGQYAFATIGFALYRHFGNRFVACFDINREHADSFARFYGIGEPARTAAELIVRPEVDYVYIASNHASHTDYALQVLAAGEIPYVEKPVSVDHEQFRRLVLGVRRCERPIYAGYNRPFSQAIRLLKGYCDLVAEPMTLSCFISGHRIGADHWYRQPQEGTRICGNVGHWLDLAVHMLSWVGLPDQWKITLVFSDENARDDDMAIALTSDRGDLVTIVLTARSEPFEGINETINFQKGSVAAKIDDFRSMTVWKGETVKRHRFWPKDAGHRLAIIQPFFAQRREWHEVELSTLLMLYIKEMVVAGECCAEFSFAEEWERVSREDLSTEIGA